MANEAVISKGRKRVRTAIGVTFANAEGQLIVRSVPIQAPDPPQCASPKCWRKFVRDIWFCAVLSKYHHDRVVYAQYGNKYKDIPEKYRTGEPSPKTIFQAIKEIIKLKLRR